MRYRGRFDRSSYPTISVDPSDEGEALEDKWKWWRENESWKRYVFDMTICDLRSAVDKLTRLVFHCYLRDAQLSMTRTINPMMTYAELTLPLPESKELWFAKTAEEWKSQLLLRSAGQSQRSPCLGDLMRDITILSASHQRLDMHYVISIYLHAYWSLILEWRRLATVHCLDTFSDNSQDGPSLMLNLRHQELCKTLRGFQVEWHAAHSPREALLLNFNFMHLYVSLDDLLNFTGKDGEEQARRIYPTLQRWSESIQARQSLWHAGQILRHAKAFPAGQLKEVYAVGMYQATLVLWTYGVVTRTSRTQPAASPATQEPVYLDEIIETAEVQQFISLGQGRPTLRGFPPSEKHQRGVEAGLDDPRSCMRIAVDVLRANFNSGKDHLPPVVENFCQLINQLGTAAWAVGLG